MSRAHDVWKRIKPAKFYGDWFQEQLEIFIGEHPELFSGIDSPPVRQRVDLFYAWLEERYGKS